ncbi:MAG: divalent metal cation transporter [Clostridium fessum]
MRGQDIANKVVPGLGYFIAFLVSLGGLVFNIGNVGGAATGFNIVFGFPLKVGTVVAGVIGILIFLSKDAKNFMDKLTKYLGSIMIVTVLYVAFRSKPPVVEAISGVGHLNEFPNLVFPIITLLGGSLRRLHHILRCTSSSGCRFLRNQGSSACSPLRINGHQRIGRYENFTVPRSFRRCYSNSGSCWKRSMGSKPASSSF